MSKVESVNVAVVRNDAWTGRMGRSGIDKHPVVGEIMLGEQGVQGDTIVDLEMHGGPFRAVYAYSREDLEFWSAELGRDLMPGNAGENLTLFGVDCNHAVIGERWRVGNAVLRVTGPRTPCRVLAGYWGVPRLVKRFSEVARHGAYLAVEEPGPVQAGDPVELLDRPEHGVRVSQQFAFRAGGRRDLTSVLRAAWDDLSPEWRGWLDAAE
ncbi:MOSC domain-containing protein [Solihabitans fulvus]|uniref:MOSC domain-containing protein n=1 Tax=Solihabitans fulvus TaxID=1892852 RepID=A0A5B2XRU5_9PSEU|nr:MOSC domain-containing protein [Solihabitans fulvus]KAA2266096.1 MOSC domain-containing protein [Solihabitans fulvus]